MILLGAAVGMLNGLLVTILRLQPFMVTLCGLFIFRSLARWLTNDTNSSPQRSVLLLHVFFLGLTSPGRARDYLTRQAELADQRLTHLQELEASMDWDDGALTRHGRLALEYGLRLAAMQRDWATWAAAHVDAGRAPASRADQTNGRRTADRRPQRR